MAPSVDSTDRHFAWPAEVAWTGGPRLARLAELLLHVDLISVYTALARGVDPTPIEAVDRLKAVLA